jgi:hypothetical protein
VTNRVCDCFGVVDRVEGNVRIQDPFCGGIQWLGELSSVRALRIKKRGLVSIYNQANSTAHVNAPKDGGESSAGSLDHRRTETLELLGTFFRDDLSKCFHGTLSGIV